MASSQLAADATEKCDDRHHFHHDNVCASISNYTQPLDRRLLYPPLRESDLRWKDCDDPTHQQNGSRHRICVICLAAATRQDWFKNTIERIQTRPPQVETFRTRQFLTRLCILCEIRESLLISQWEGWQNTLPPPYPPKSQLDRMEDFPSNRCTCRADLLQGIKCHDHRKALFHSHGLILNARKIQNRRWLSNVALDTTGQTVPATKLEKANRINQRLWRACRCGADPIPNVQNAWVLQCMACEGMVEVRPLRNFQIFQAIATAEQLAQNSLTRPDLFALGRLPI